MATAEDVEYLAAFDADTGEFVDFVRSDASGLCFRERGDWINYQPSDTTLDGKEIIEVEESFAEVADKAEAAGTRPTREQAAKHSADGRL